MVNAETVLALIAESTELLEDRVVPSDLIARSFHLFDDGISAAMRIIRKGRKVVAEPTERLMALLADLRECPPRVVH